MEVSLFLPTFILYKLSSPPPTPSPMGSHMNHETYCVRLNRVYSVYSQLSSLLQSGSYINAGGGGTASRFCLVKCTCSNYIHENIQILTFQNAAGVLNCLVQFNVGQDQLVLYYS